MPRGNINHRWRLPIPGECLRIDRCCTITTIDLGNFDCKGSLLPHSGSGTSSLAVSDHFRLKDARSTNDRRRSVTSAAPGDATGVYARSAPINPSPVTPRRARRRRLRAQSAEESVHSSSSAQPLLTLSRSRF